MAFLGLKSRFHTVSCRKNGAFACFIRCMSSKSEASAEAFRLRIIFEDNHLLVVNKPSGILSQGDSTGDESMFSIAKQYLAHCRGKSSDTSSVYLGLVHRLDRVSSGVLVFAKRTKAAARVSECLRTREGVEKHYLCVVHGDHPDGESIVLEDLLIEAAGTDSKNKTRIYSPTKSAVMSIQNAVHARLEYRSLGPVEKHPPGISQSILHVQPTTGRKHQIRAQLSHANMPIVWDGKYGAPARSSKERGIALHALSLLITHPAPPGLPILFTAPVPERWGIAFGNKVFDVADKIIEQIEKEANLNRKK